MKDEYKGIFVSSDTYNTIVSIAAKEKRTIKAQMEIIVEHYAKEPEEEVCEYCGGTGEVTVGEVGEFDDIRTKECVCQF